MKYVANLIVDGYEKEVNTSRTKSKILVGSLFSTALVLVLVIGAVPQLAIAANPVSTIYKFIKTYFDDYGRYSVEIIVDIGSAEVGNSLPVSMYVHVTFQGKPVYGLISDNFHVSIVASPLGATPEGPSAFFQDFTVYPAVYKFQAVPFSPDVWLAGKYIVLIGVRNPAPPSMPNFTGEALTSITL